MLDRKSRAGWHYYFWSRWATVCFLAHHPTRRPYAAPGQILLRLDRGTPAAVRGEVQIAPGSLVLLQAGPVDCALVLDFHFSDPVAINQEMRVTNPVGEQTAGGDC
jgi:hypothetical protein